MSTPPVASQQLVDISARVLALHGFTVASERTAEGLEVLLAENPHFIICLGAVARLESLHKLEAEASTLLLDRIESSDIGPKRWDVYLVLLSEERPGELDTNALFSIAYNTRLFRRIVRVGLSPTDDDIATALRAFLPLTPRSRSEVGDALELLAAELPSHGADRVTVERAIASFRATRTITNV